MILIFFSEIVVSLRYVLVENNFSASNLWPFCLAPLYRIAAIRNACECECALCAYVCHERFCVLKVFLWPGYWARVCAGACLCLSLIWKGHLGCPCGRARAILKRSGHRAKYLHCCACSRAPRRRKLSEFNSAHRPFPLIQMRKKTTTERRAKIHTQTCA